MEFRDWKAVVDFLARLELNVLGVGIYGCWNVFFQEQVQEFLFVPVPKHPRLKTPKTMTYYSPQSRGQRNISYLPRMFEQDFLGDIISHGKSRGMTVFPIFNSLGHNTLLPREYPETSSVDDRGRPNHYGFCLSSPETYDLLFSVYGTVIANHLAPQGVTWFGIGLDEIVPVSGIDPNDRERVVDPWCQCASCRRRPKEEMFLEFILKAAHFLVDSGMDQVFVYHDQLEAFGLFRPALVERLEREGLKERIVFIFWDYEDRGPGKFVDLHPELDIRRWVTPMTCCFNWVSFQSKVDNIWNLLARGLKANACATMSYSTFDWGWADHFLHLSRAAAHTGRICRAQVDIEFARMVFGARWKKGLTAIRLLNDYGLLVASLGGLTGPYPTRDLMKRLVADNRQRLHTMERMLGWVDQAHEMLTECRGSGSSGLAAKVKQSLWAESVRTRNLLEEFIILGKAYPKRPGKSELRRCLKLHRETMRAIEDTKPHYLIPSNLACLTPLHDHLTGALERSGT
jgi:hypothetical protein